MAEAVPSPAERFAKQLPNKDSDLTEQEAVPIVTKTGAYDLNGLAANNKADVLAVPKKLEAV